MRKNQNRRSVVIVRTKGWLALLLAIVLVLPSFSLAASADSQAAVQSDGVTLPVSVPEAPLPGVTEVNGTEATSVDPSLLAWYTFEGDTLSDGLSGARKVLDLSGNANDATMFWGSGAFENVLEGADGASLKFSNPAGAGGAYVKLPPDILSDTDDYTVSMWYKLSGAPGWARLFDFGSAEAGTADTREAYIMFAPYSWNTQALFETTADYSQGTSRIHYTGSNTVNEWTHIAISRDGTATRIYMNGILYATGKSGISPRGYEFLGAYLGRSGFEGDSFFDGEMDDVRIFNRALTADQVLEQYTGYPKIAAIEAQGGPYLMTYTLPAGFSGHLDEGQTPNPLAIQQAGVFDYSLHYAYSENGKTWIPLNDNRGILYWKDNGRFNANTSYRYINPRIVLTDGIYHLYADAVRYQNNVVDGSYLHWTSADLVNWVQDNVVMEVPEISFISDNVDLTAKPYNAAVGGIIPISEAELTSIKDAYATPYFDDVDVTTVVGAPAGLPDYGTISLTDGRKVDYGHSVTWDGVPDYSAPGVYEITGRVNYNYSNPLTHNGADPDIYYHDGWYYYTSSWMDETIPVSQQNQTNQYMRVTLRRARTVQGLAASEERTIFEGPTASSERGSAHIWAPEIHRLTFDGVSTWAIYWAGSPISNKWDIRMMVATCSTDDPWTGEWSTANVIDDGNTSNNFDLDATVLTHNGKNYLIWANTRTGASSLWIAEMTSPTAIDTDTALQQCIIAPEYTFENRNDRVIEGPTILKENGRIWLSYSGGSTNANYNMGLAYAIDSPATDVMSPSSWTKLKYPIMHADRAAQQFGPGHATFTYDYNVNGIKPFPILSYHARGDENYATNHSPAPLYSPTRWARIAPVYYHRDGTPWVGTPPADGLIPTMAIKGTITVLPSDQITLSPLSRTFKPAADGYTTVLSEAFTVTNPADTQKEIDLSVSSEYFSLDKSVITVPGKTENGSDGFATFTVTPVLGLPVGTYSGKVTVADGDVTRTANVYFTVLEVSTGRYSDSSFDLTVLKPSAVSSTTSYISNAAPELGTFSGNVIQALYKDDHLLSVVLEPFTIVAGESKIVKTSLTLPDKMDDGDYSLKLFVWDSSFMPLGEAVDFVGYEYPELPSPYLWYDFNQESGTDIPDVSGNGNNGTLQTGSTGSYVWDGSSLTLSNNSTTQQNTGHYVFAPKGIMDGKDTFTLSFFAMQDFASGAANRFTFAIQQDPAATPDNYFFLNNAGRYKAAITNNNWAGEAAGGLVEAAAGNRNVWEHYVVVMTPTKMTMYVNGELVGSADTTVKISDLGTNLNVDLGRSAYNPDSLYSGAFGDMRIYSEALTDGQVKALSNSILDKTEPRLPQSLVSDWAALSLSKPSGSILTGALSAPPKFGPSGSVVTWGATNPAFLSVDGVVRRPGEEEGDQSAILIATLKASTGETVTKTFAYTVAATSDIGDVAADAASLTVGSDPYVVGIDLVDFEMDAILPAVGPGGNTTVVWETSDPTVMTADGKNLVTYGQNK